MNLYSRRTFSKESFQWTKCVVKYLYDTYAHLSLNILAFLVEVSTHRWSSVPVRTCGFHHMLIPSGSWKRSVCFATTRSQHHPLHAPLHRFSFFGGSAHQCRSSSSYSQIRGLFSMERSPENTQTRGDEVVDSGGPIGHSFSLGICPLTTPVVFRKRNFHEEGNWSVIVIWSRKLET